MAKARGMLRGVLEEGAAAAMYVPQCPRRQVRSKFLLNMGDGMGFGEVVADICERNEVSSLSTRDGTLFNSRSGDQAGASRPPRKRHCG